MTFVCRHKMDAPNELSLAPSLPPPLFSRKNASHEIGSMLELRGVMNSVPFEQLRVCRLERSMPLLFSSPFPLPCFPSLSFLHTRRFHIERVRHR